ncbi:MAG: 16S rRNA (guanine(966)-N(2))-methyltransferase RsmD [Bacillota bacterium]|nr:MAG: 16S rRNA (guanine(966)-N(2))-methyltransferase RsmD [Bacillota bacterium]
MRIIGGTHRGRILDRVGKDSTRESADMVKLAVFNMIGVQMHGMVLDLFAGSGAYGLESISRGASHVYLVDKDRDACKTMHLNAQKLDMLEHVFILNQDYQRFLDGLSHTILFDYVFLDPPYEMDVYESVILKLIPNLNVDGFVICESKKQLVLPEKIESLTKIKDKTYGIKRISIYQKS